ncbi:hypothetical protein N7517_003064 [Penicillium concentricum]|uniref:J domain-containing protein n=1 Tax=Penicillium concentricum TaxID=293559 RepID=A0A9W9SY85_9EURO|nr:uncharacterized protein N7517_003064 [Penicillium concentricum]KAJ5385153.1 hypothetical protein N7517_003064 [Penicillium concentricum]
MSTPPDIDPYAVLGVAKDANITEIRAAHRKRVLKCHPDKIQDESQRIAAQDEFQKVQQAYELLSDDVRRTKHDQKVKIAELKRELLERRRTDSSYNSPRGSGASTREFRNGHYMEERVPIEVFFEEELRFTEEPRSTTARKCEEFGLRPKTKPTEEKKKARTPMSMYHQAKEEQKTAKATHSDRAKTRDQERRRQAEEKRDTFGSYPESDEDTSDSSIPRYHTRRTSITPRRERDSRSRPSESSRRREHRYDEDGDVDDHWQSKLDTQYFHAEDYIASKAQGSKSPRRYHGHDSAEPELSTPRSAGRSTRTRRRSSSRDDSYEHLESTRTYEAKPPKLQPSATTPGLKGSFRPSFLSTRSATTTGFVRPKPTREPTLHDMSRERLPPRTSRMRERNDSGYSSPSTPEMVPRGSSPKTSVRYKVVKEPDHIVVEPKSSKYRSARSPDRDRIPSTRPTPKRSSTYTAEAIPRFETRSARPSARPHPDVEYISRPNEKDIKYARAYKQDDINYAPRRPHYPYYEEDGRPPAVGRRQPAY